MEIETLTGKRTYTTNNSSLISSALSYDLPEIVKKMKDSPEWENGELNAVILLDSFNKKIVLTVMHDRTEVKSFQSGDSVAIQIIEGRMKVQTNQETVILDEGQLLVLHDKIKFSLTTLKESALLLTIFTGAQKMKGN
jgi:quercetin dioxygenase-like cupin family protein